MSNDKRAIISGKIVTNFHGRRLTRSYKAGERLTGCLEQDDAPPFTGFVRGWFRNRGKS